MAASVPRRKRGSEPGDEPLCPSLVAEMLAVPALTPVTTPLVLQTVARAGLLDVQVTTRPVSTAPPASLVVAVPWVAAPTVTEEVASATVTDATAGGDAVTGPVTLPAPSPHTDAKTHRMTSGHHLVIAPVKGPETGMCAGIERKIHTVVELIRLRT